MFDFSRSSSLDNAKRRAVCGRFLWLSRGRWAPAAESQRGNFELWIPTGTSAVLEVPVRLIGRHRQTSVGILLWVKTFTVSLPSTSAETPFRPWEAMTIRSQPRAIAVSIIAAHG